MKKSDIKRIKILALILLVCSAASFGQSPQEIEEKMDDIKLDSKYLYAESTRDNKDLAFDDALNQFVVRVNELYETSQIPCEITVKQVLTRVSDLEYFDDGYYTVMVYMPVAEILDVNNMGVETAAPENVPVTVQIQSPAPSPSEAVSPDQVPSQAAASARTAPAAPAPAPYPTGFVGSGQSVTQTLSSLDNWKEMKEIIINFKSEGKIKENGNCYNMEEVPADAYAILFDGYGGILAILSPKNSPTRINHKTNRSDNETNHPDYKFIFWYK